MTNASGCRAIKASIYTFGTRTGHERLEVIVTEDKCIAQQMGSQRRRLHSTHPFRDFL